ncbi:MAG: heme lyase CcmF/NrfE family subunit [Rhizobiaceae bacterium]
MIVELGHFALVLGLAMSIAQVLVGFLAAKSDDGRLAKSAGNIALAGFASVTLAFLALINAHVSSDFSVANVFENSHTQMPLIYRVSGVWGNHEGSMLLWVFILTLFNALVVLFGTNLPDRLKSNVLGFQGMIASAFVLFILATSNPFARLENPPVEGRDLNPVLQDLGLAIHPPMLYLGYVGFSVAFSFAMAALLDGRIDAAWARWVRPWTLAAWMFLTAGIAMGSYWAYYELGWGGWWFWDPVENASFMPWLSGTALLHTAVVMEKRGALKIWTVLLAIVTFSFSLLGTFLVRSGVLTSVHSFASDPSRGLFILLILSLFVGGALTLFALRAGQIEQGGLFHPISREGALVFNNLFLTTAAASVLIGTLYPLVLEALTGHKISVGAPFFNLTFGPLMVPLLMAMPFGPLLAWKRGDLYGASQRLLFVLILSALAGFAAIWVATGAPVLAALGIGLAVWVMVGSTVDLAGKAGFGKNSFAVAMGRLRGLPRSVFGTFLGHFGIGLTTLGIVTVSIFGTETVVEMKPGERVAVAGYELTFDGLKPFEGPNFKELQGSFHLSRPSGEMLATLVSSKRTYNARGMPTTEAGIETRMASQVYVSLGDQTGNGGIVVRVWWKPLVTLIWLGAVFMVIGAVTSLSDRRLRVGAPSPAKRAPEQAIAA